MGGLGYLFGKGCLIVATVVQLDAGMALCTNPATAPAGALLISGAEASAAMLVSPVDPVSTVTTITTGVV